MPIHTSTHPPTPEAFSGPIHERGGDYRLLLPLHDAVKVESVDGTSQPMVLPFTGVNWDTVPDSREQLPLPDIVHALEVQRVVKRAPDIADIADDPTRTNRITQYVAPYAVVSAAPAAVKRTLPVAYTSEQKAVTGLLGFLEQAKTLGTHGGTDLGARAQDMQKRLTFIGEREWHEATEGIASYWKDWLRQDPGRQLCVLTGATEHSTQEQSAQEVKSNRFLLDSILGYFSDRELAEFAPRLTTDTESLLSTSPAQTKIVLLDDWMISGNQLASSYRWVARHIPSRYHAAIEIQVVTSPKDRIERGKSLTVDGRRVKVPLRSYFLSHQAGMPTSYAVEGHTAYETGAHATVDFDFDADIDRMRRKLQEETHEPIAMPLTTNIRRDYKFADLPNLQRLHEAQAAA